MTQITRLARQGNSLGLRIPKEYLERLQLKQGDAVTLDLEGSRLVITRASDAYQEAMDLGRQCAARYRSALAKLAK